MYTLWFAFKCMPSPLVNSIVHHQRSILREQQNDTLEPDPRLLTSAYILLVDLPLLSQEPMRTTALNRDAVKYTRKVKGQPPGERKSHTNPLALSCHNRAPLRRKARPQFCMPMAKVPHLPLFFIASLHFQTAFVNSIADSVAK